MSRYMMSTLRWLDAGGSRRGPFLPEASPVITHVRFQDHPQFRNSERAVGIQLLKELLPGHGHGLETQKIERQLLTFSNTVVMIS